MTDGRSHPEPEGDPCRRQQVIRLHWDDILQLATSIKQCTVTASLMLRELGSYPRQNGLAVAPYELGHIERTLIFSTDCRALSCSGACTLA